MEAEGCFDWESKPSMKVSIKATVYLHPCGGSQTPTSPPKSSETQEEKKMTLLVEQTHGSQAAPASQDGGGFAGRELME